MDWMPSAKPSVTLKNSGLDEMSKNERLKVVSRGLFVVDPDGGITFRDELDVLTRGEAQTLSNTAKELSKFFGIYKQQSRGERGKKTRDYFFMVRIKCPGGGTLSREQWVALDRAADAHGDGTLRITSRQGIQFHHVYGPHLAPLVRDLNRGYRDQGTLGACGDVNRNVMCSPVDDLDPDHAPRAFELAEAIATELAPRTSAYFQVFLADENGRSATTVNPEEPIYGEHYLPRKFKVGIAHPADNSIDVLTQDVGLVPVATNGRSDGSAFDLWSGGGLGMTHNKPETVPLLGLYLGRIRRDQVVDAVRGIALLQKENGERKDRRQSRWKYTIRRMGLDIVKKELRERFGIALEDAEPQPLAPIRVHLGWHEGQGGTGGAGDAAGAGWYGIPVENGRLKGAQRQAVRKVVEELGLSVRLTPQQDLMLLGVRDPQLVESMLRDHGVPLPGEVSAVRRNAISCPAKPTCGLAMTDAEGILPAWIDAIEEAGLGDLDVMIRMTGCPNMCARPPTAEIGIYGYGKNDHVILVGGSREGTRVGKTLFPRLPAEAMVPALTGLLRAIRDHNDGGLPPGEFLHRTDVGRLRDWIALDDARLQG